MSKEYTSEMKNNDALAFVRTRFGKHYIKRLTKAYNQAVAISQDITYSREYRLDCATQASAFKRELNYFELHKKFNQDKGIAGRLRDKLRKEKPIEL